MFDSVWEIRLLGLGPWVLLVGGVALLWGTACWRSRAGVSGTGVLQPGPRSWVGYC